MELSNECELAHERNFKNKLVDLAIGMSHLNHMPTHISLLCGDYK